MSKVKKLDSSTINKIAAGEVVERPASVVKELVENAIDAGATRIEVEIQEGGKSFIRVSDNGCGMDTEDASLAICRHATSKIATAEDLNEIATLGFRGEALPTIMSVSNFKMHTRPANSELGTFIGLKGGLDQEMHETGCPLGTTVQVEDLFFNTPARKKFLKSNNTEGTKIHDFIVKLAISRPSIAFKFINGNRNAVNTPGTGNLFDTITSIYGREIADSLLEIDFTDKADSNFTIKGYISKPNVLKSYRSWQTFIVNGRVINNRIIAKAVDESYKSMIPKTGYPLAILIFDLQPYSIDVNVHPQKTEIRFEDEGEIYRAVYIAIKQALENRTFVDDNNNENATSSNVPEFHNIAARPQLSRPSITTTRSYDSGLNKTKQLLMDYKAKDNAEYEMHNAGPNAECGMRNAECGVTNSASTQLSRTSHSEFRILNSELSPIGQVDLCYIIARDEHDLYIVDQHAAHERILFDRFSGYTDGIPAQQLLIHQIIKFDEREAQIVEENLELFHNLGFTMEPSGENEFRLIEVPIDIDNTDSEDILREILSSLPPLDDVEANDEQQKAISKNIRQAVIATTACRAAIKAGQELNFRQMQIILDQLYKTEHPFTCPHGRPTIIKFTSHDLAKMFKRTGF